VPSSTTNGTATLYLAVNALLSGATVAVVSEFAGKSPNSAHSIRRTLRVWHDTSDIERRWTQPRLSHVLPVGGDAAPRNRILVNTCGLLHADFDPLSRNDLDSRKV
jgi:hypothetical protein